MRRLIFALLAAALLVPSGCRVWNNPLDPENNEQPYIPSRPFPDSGAIRQDTVVVLSWNGGDPNPGDTVRYDLLLGASVPPPVVARGLDTTRYTATGLDYSTLYYWQVIAFDSRGDSTAGPVWSFTTWAVTDTNQPPYQPSSPSPANGAGNVDTAVVLRWSGGDPDSGDIVRYDIHLGTSSPPPLAQAGLGDTTWDPPGLACRTSYYWQVRSFDNHGDTTPGPVWSFTTAAPSDTNRPPNVPSNPTPDSGATGRTRQAVLFWQGGDPDPLDTVRYDVYFGTTTTPPRVAQSLAEPVFTPTGLEPTTTYFWRVVARDRAGDTTAGPLWPFATMAEIVVTSPTQSTSWREGSRQTIRWTGGTDGGASQKSEVRLLKSAVRTSRPARTARGAGLPADGADSTVVFFSSDNGGSWSRQARATEPGELDWTVAGATPDARIEVRAFADGRHESGTSERFVITDTLRPSEITITSPTRDTRWQVGSSQVISWTGGTDGFDSAVVRYHAGTGEWIRQGRTLVPGSFDWTVPQPLTNLARVEVTAYCMSQSRSATSDTFRVVAPPLPDTVIKVLTVGERPQDLAWNPDQDLVYTADFLGGSVTVIDAASDSVVATLAVGSNPTALAWDEQRGELWVANSGSRSLSVIDGATSRVVDSVAVGSTPTSLAISATGGKVYVANRGADSLTVVEAATRQVVARLATGDNPYHVAWHPVLDRVYVPCFGGNELTVVDCAADTVLARVGVGFGACFAAVDTVRNEVWVANRLGNNVSVVDCATNQPVATVNAGGSPWALALNPTSSRLYCLLKDDDAVGVISTVTRGISLVGVGTGPRCVTWCPGINKVYVGNYDSDDVTLIDGANNSVLGTIRTGIGDKPQALLWNPSAGKVYCANYGDASVSVIGTVE